MTLIFIYKNPIILLIHFTSIQREAACVTLIKQFKDIIQMPQKFRRKNKQTIIE